MQGVSGNVIREILKLTQQSDIISFAGGLPSADSFPRAELQRISAEILQEVAPLQYGTTEGYTPLREFIASWVAERGVQATPDDVLILSGSQQGIDLAFKVFLDPGDKVLVERPTYLAMLQILQIYEGQAVEVPGDAEGMDPDALEAAIRNEHPKLIYLVPTFRNPSGETISAERRQAIVDVAARYGVPVIEDDPYGLLRYSGEPIPVLKAYDREGIVIYLGSFSKIIAPGLRVGYAVGSPERLRPMAVAKQGADVHTSVFNQAIIARFCREGLLGDHLKRVTDQYRVKRDAMLDAVARYFPAEARWTRPDGGLFLWVELPDELNATRLLEEAVTEKVAFIPGDPFYADGTGTSAMRLNFSNATLDDIELGMQRLGRVITRALTDSTSPRR